MRKLSISRAPRQQNYWVHIAVSWIAAQHAAYFDERNISATYGVFLTTDFVANNPRTVLVISISGWLRDLEESRMLPVHHSSDAGSQATAEARRRQTTEKV